MSASYDSTLDDLFRALRWRRLDYQRLVRKSLLMYKAINGMTPDYLGSRFVYRDNVNAYRLRNTEEKLVLPQPRSYYLKVEWYPKREQKGLFKYGEKRSIVFDCTREQNINFEGFTQNGSYGNQPQSFEVVFYSIDANTSCSVTKQNLTFKQAYRTRLCFVLCNEPKLDS